MGAIENLERQARKDRINTYLRSRANRKIKNPKKIGIINLLRDMGLGSFNKGGIVAKTKSKFKGHF